MRKGDWMQTYTGRQFWPMDPRPEEVCIEDIAHALSLQCRFAGHCREFYSVAEHSVRVARVLRDRGHSPVVQLMGLLHDASEAYLVDVPRPLKPYLKGYRPAEDAVMAAICERFGLRGLDDWPFIKEADNILLATEARDLMGPPPAPWAEMPPPLWETIVPESPGTAKMIFLTYFKDLHGAA